MAKRALLYECFSGISGDMHIGAMVDVGVPVDYLSDQLAKLELADEFELEIASGSKLGVTGTPTFFVNGRRLIDRPNYESMKRAVDEELARTEPPASRPAAR